LNCQIWQSKAARVGYFRPVTCSDRGISGDHFGACVVNFGGHTRH
jgi:hypothetical protein